MSLNPFKRNDDLHEFKPILAEIEDDPGSPLGQTTFWLVVLIFTFFLGWSIFGQMDIVITARGKLVPVGNVKVLQPLTTGVIRQILVKEGDFVKKGQELVVIDPATTEPLLESYQENLRHLQLERARLNAATDGQNFSAGGNGAAQTQRELYAASREKLARQVEGREAELKRLNGKIDETMVEIGHTKEDLAIQQEKKNRLDSVKDLIAQDDYQKVTDAILEDQSKLKQLDYELQQMNHQKEGTQQNIDEIQAGFRSDTLADLSDKEKRINEVEANVQQVAFQNARQRLVAPVDGYVQDMSVHTVGGVVTPAEKLITVIPANTPLKVQATVLNKDIGYVKEKLPVAIKLDTFDFQKYGILRGVVAHIPKDSTETEDKTLGPIYLVDITPIDKSLMVDGHRESLSSGLSVTAEIKVGKRHIIEFFIYPLIKHWHEGLSVR